MVKIHKMFCIETELNKKLRGINGSELVNRLLLEFYEGNYGENPKKLRSKYLEFRAEKAIFSKKMKQISKKLAEIQAKNEAEKAKEMTSEKQLARKIKVQEMKTKLQNEEITEEQFWTFIDGK